MFDENDDMDELFRRAAENYPLKTDSADWEKIAKDIRASQPADRNKRWLSDRRSLLLLSLLLPAAIICNRYSHVASNNNSTAQTASVPQTQSADRKVTQNKTSFYQINPGVEDKETPAKKEIAERKNSGSTTIRYVEPDKQIAPAMLFNKAGINNHSTPSNITLNDTEEIVAAKNEALAGNTDSIQLPAETTRTSIEKKETHAESIPINTPVKKESKSSKNAMHLYAGIIGNVDISTVNLQALRAPGTGAGFLIGLQLTKQLSFESGIYKQKKFYYSDAKYYNPETPYTAPSFKLLNVDGNCSMYEVPINLKYDFKAHLKSNWYAITGFSSYFMKKENYTYTSEMWGRVSQKDVSYDSTSSSLFSIINIGAGYQRHLGKSGLLRIEPYIKIPLKGFGWGRLPVMSSGLYVGYTRTLF